VAIICGTFLYSFVDKTTDPNKFNNEEEKCSSLRYWAMGGAVVMLVSMIMFIW